MKRLLASSLAVLMAGAMLAGCGDSNSSSKADTASSKAETTTTAAESKAEESVAESKAEESKAEESKAEESSAAEESKAEATSDIKYDPAATETVIEVEDPTATSRSVLLLHL